MYTAHYIMYIMSPWWNVFIFSLTIVSTQAAKHGSPLEQFMRIHKVLVLYSAFAVHLFEYGNISLSTAHGWLFAWYYSGNCKQSVFINKLLGSSFVFVLQN